MEGFGLCLEVRAVRNIGFGDEGRQESRMISRCFLFLPLAAGWVLMLFTKIGNTEAEQGVIQKSMSSAFLMWV